jgi:hypothetical protein
MGIEHTVNAQLEQAVHQREVGVLALLVEQGANAHIVDDKLTMQCIQKQHYDVLQELIRLGADPQGRKCALLIGFIRRDDVKGLKLLVSLGANVNACEVDLLRVCRRESAVQCWRYMYKQGADPANMGWQYFAGIMGPVALVKATMKKSDGKAYRNTVKQYQKVMDRPLL